MNQFRQFRLERSLTHKQAAALFGVHRRSYIKWETGETDARGPAVGLLERLEREYPVKEVG